MPTALTAVQICNLALSRVGVLQTISSLSPPYASPAAAACAAVYDQCRLECIQEFPWSWASKYIDPLVLVAGVPATNAQANAEWLYAYTYPTDALQIRRLLPTIIPAAGSPPNVPPYRGAWSSFNRADTNPAPPPFEIGYLGTSRVIYTDMANAACKYTFDQTDTTVYVPNFTNMLAWRVAMELAMSLANSNDKKQWAKSNYQEAEREAESINANESQNSQPFVQYNAETIRARQDG